MILVLTTTLPGSFFGVKAIIAMPEPLFKTYNHILHRRKPLIVSIGPGKWPTE